MPFFCMWINSYLNDFVSQEDQRLNGYCEWHFLIPLLRKKVLRGEVGRTQIWISLFFVFCFTLISWQQSDCVEIISFNRKTHVWRLTLARLQNPFLFIYLLFTHSGIYGFFLVNLWVKIRVAANNYFIINSSWLIFFAINQLFHLWNVRKI